MYNLTGVKEKHFTLSQKIGETAVEKNYRLSLLLDYYGELLTDKQREMVTLYYNDDLSLSEIAENFGITRQGVRDSIKRAEAVLNDFEEKVGFYEYYSRMSVVLDDVECLSREISKSNKLEDAILKAKRIVGVIESEKNKIG